MTITLPDELISALASIYIDIEERPMGQIRMVVIERTKTDDFEIVDGYGVTLQEAAWALERNAEDWLRELTEVQP